ncbi:MAG: hypothetical protein H6832_03650 [Planctomycetes bacterium]|nr:hypothetical protein [Planctomycetota bacterium]
MVRRRTKLAVLALPLLLPLQSCCTIFGLFGCGTGIPITDITWNSPDATIHTLLTAIRASDTKVIYEAMSEDFKRAYGIDGVGFAIAWERLSDRVPGLHLAGDAEIVERGPVLDAQGNAVSGRERFRLSSHGYGFDVEVGRYAYWDVGAADPDSGETRVIGSYTDRLDGCVIDEIKGLIDARIRSPELVGLSDETFRYLEIGWTWKVLRLARTDE